jgi:hypothetical protein
VEAVGGGGGQKGTVEAGFEGGACERIRQCIVGFPFLRARPRFRGPKEIYAGQPKFWRAEWGPNIFSVRLRDAIFCFSVRQRGAKSGSF